MMKDAIMNQKQFGITINFTQILFRTRNTFRDKKEHYNDKWVTFLKILKNSKYVCLQQQNVKIHEEIMDLNKRRNRQICMPLSVTDRISSKKPIIQR